ncbi:hypothetical protein I302_105378 [Kwoniella bestiolae CBS 10118]|uniref:Major facilitator superfamily (MFS) profile domain-containing protein n=1 Tax=Kwoniella bestiolae CBS 10118 TaxID=1296100 RepID=A0A1B9FSX9_9TREE|nr:hypothetical protein I302_08660 [Kwoniella bestiolae CBS 10118]OCF21881.1 hypothetical protein I302_08660 [Kwoniella bestiolae CBS 10118]
MTDIPYDLSKRDSEKTLCPLADPIGTSSAPCPKEYQICQSLPQHPTAQAETDGQIEANDVKVGNSFSERKKWSLLALFSFSLIVDQWAYTAYFLFTPAVSNEYSIPAAQQSWVINSYVISFGSTILLFGRISDLYPPSTVFTYGFLTLGLLNLIISFLPEMYSYFVFRAISGIAAAALIPSAFKLISGIFPKEQLGKALTIYSAAAPVGGGSGAIIAGVVDLIPYGTGQMSAWRWFSRILAVMIFIPAVGSIWWMPKDIGRDPSRSEESSRQKFIKLDLGGSFIILSAVLLLILSLTMGGDHGFNTAYFIAPFIISLFLFPTFLWYESRLPEGYPLLPPSIFKLTNVGVFLFLGLILFSWWSANLSPLFIIYLTYRGESGIAAGARLFPQAAASIVVTLLLARWSWFTHHPRYAITTGLTLAIAAYAVFSQSTDQVGTDYWKFIFPPEIFGSAGAMMVYSATNVGVMTAVPPSIAGTAGGLLQVSFQVGSALALGIQAGLFTIHDGYLANFKNVQISWYFEMGWLGLGLLVFLVGYRNVKKLSENVEVGH